MKPKCYDCRHRGPVPGSVHSSCHHPATILVHDDPLAKLIGIIGKRSGETWIPSSAARELHIEAAALGIRNGWFLWPVNYDPVWLERCDGFEASEEAIARTVGEQYAPVLDALEKGERP